MIVISNTKVNRDFVVPEIAITINGTNINIGAIDKVVHAKFLAANPKIIFFNYYENDYNFNTDVCIIDYTGDELDTDIQINAVFSAISVFETQH